LDDRGVRFHGVRTDGSRVVAWGDKDAEDGVGRPGSRAISIVWTSDDGLAWRRHEARLPGGEPLRLASVNVSPEGFAALGSSGGPPQMATSVDGGEWRLFPAPVQPPGPVYRSVGGLVTVGLGPAAPVVFVSGDGSDWRAIHGPAQPGQYRIGDIARTADGLVISGAFGAQGNWDGLLWRWSMSGGLVDLGGLEPAFVGPARSVTLHQAVPHAGGVYVRGSVDLAVPGECAVRDGLVAALGPPIADVCGRTDLVWASSDWVRWQELEDTLPLMSPETVVAGVDGLVAILHTAPGGENFDDPSVWTSSDGIEWRRLANGVASATALVALPDRLLAFAQDHAVDTGFVVWVGTPR